MQPQPVEWVQGFFGVFLFNYEPLNASQVWLLPSFLLLLVFSSCCYGSALKFKWVEVLVVFRCFFFISVRNLLGFSDFCSCYIWGEGLRDLPNAPHDWTGKSMLDRPHYAANGLAQTFTGNYRHFAGHLLLDRCYCCHWGFHFHWCFYCCCSWKVKHRILGAEIWHNSFSFFVLGFLGN